MSRRMSAIGSSPSPTGRREAIARSPFGKSAGHHATSRLNSSQQSRFSMSDCRVGENAIGNRL